MRNASFWMLTVPLYMKKGLTSSHGIWANIKRSAPLRTSTEWITFQTKGNGGRDILCGRIWKANELAASHNRSNEFIFKELESDPYIWRERIHIPSAEQPEVGISCERRHIACMIVFSVTISSYFRWVTSWEFPTIMFCAMKSSFRMVCTVALIALGS